MRKLFSSLVILMFFIPSILLAKMSQVDVDKLYTKPIILDKNHSTFNINLPVDSTDGYRWFLVSPEYGYVNAVKFEHESVAVEDSKWGGWINLNSLLKNNLKMFHKR